jgi:periplasmic protein TonB
LSVVTFDPDFEQKPSRRLWTMAAVGALALHLGGAAIAIIHLKEKPHGVQLGSQGIEVGLVFGSDKTEITDLPPGPDSNESAAAPELVEQKAVEKPSDLPKEKPIESDTPDQLVTTTESKKPKEEEPKLEAVQTTASQASVAQEATAKQNLDQEGTGIKEQGLSKDREKERAEYNAIISAMIERNKARHYPDDGKKKSASSVRVNFVLNRLGNVIEATVVKSSGSAAFDKAALAIIRSLDPLPKPPADLTDDLLPYVVMISFNGQK